MPRLAPAIETTGQAPLSASLSKEWERVSLICRCLSELRKGLQPSDPLRQQVLQSQQEVVKLRSSARWNQFIADHQLSNIDWDIAIFTAAPEFDPQIGWMMHQLQSSINSAAPCAALIAELLFLTTEETPLMRNRLTHSSPLFTHGILQRESDDFYAPLKPTKAFLAFLQSPDNKRVIPEIPGTTYIQHNGTLADLVISDHCRRVLDEFICFVRHRDLVETEWETRMCGGPVGLFSGPSGTGKTFAAAIVANELGYPLFRVDLGLLVSKYIGETEKNLSALFDAASGRHVLLLFDEADSLFGKRGEVRDARDRYANMEVSHLLSRMENHRGPCILTTNLRRHLDPAFARRFQMCAEFTRPDAAAQAILWKKTLPAKGPIAKEINIAELSETLSLTGAQIRNIVVHAACCAAGESKPIGNRHLARATYIEMLKEGKEVIASSLGGLKEFL